MRKWLEPIFAERTDAVNVLSSAKEYLSIHNIITIKQINEFIGENVNSNDKMYGWTNLSEAWIEKVQYGYKIRFPKIKKFKPVKLKNKH